MLNGEAILTSITVNIPIVFSLLIQYFERIDPPVANGLKPVKKFSVLFSVLGINNSTLNLALRDLVKRSNRCPYHLVKLKVFIRIDS